MPPTGEICRESGIYYSDCHKNEIPLSKGERFPLCTVCKKATNWTLVRTV
jgi:hypothetical protein